MKYTKDEIDEIDQRINTLKDNVPIDEHGLAYSDRHSEIYKLEIIKDYLLSDGEKVHRDLPIEYMKYNFSE